MERWRPSQTYTKQEQWILKRVEKKRKLFGFLRRHRSELFDDEFQAQLESMYRGTGAGKEPKPPAFLAMVLLLQGFLGVSDGDAVEVTMLDLRWQMVLDCLGVTVPAFSQGRSRRFEIDSSRTTWTGDCWSAPSSLRERPRSLTGRRSRRRCG